MTAKFHAMPYALDGGPGFSFDATASAYEEALDTYNEARRASGQYAPEEFEIQFIDGEDYEAELCKALSVHQGNIDVAIEMLDWAEGASDSEIAAVWYALDNLGAGDFDTALHQAEDGLIVHESGEYGEEDVLAEYAERITRDCNEIPGFLDFYIDWEKMGRDMRINGDVDAFEFGGAWYVANGHA